MIRPPSAKRCGSPFQDSVRPLGLILIVLMVPSCSRQEVKTPPPLPAIRPVTTLPIDAVTCVAVSEDGGLLAAGCHDNTVRLWDLQARKEKAMLAGHNGQIHAVAMSPDGKWMASGSRDTRVRLWEVATEKPVHTFLTKSDHHAILFSTDSKTLVLAGTRDKDVLLWDIASKEPRQRINQPSVSAVAITPDGKYLATGFVQALWNWSNKRLIHTLDNIGPIPSGLAITRDSKSLIIGAGADKQTGVTLWDLDQIVKQK